MKGIFVSILVLMVFGGFAQKVDSVTTNNIVAQLPKTTIRNDFIFVDGEPYTHDLNNFNLNEIYKIDVLNYEKIAEFGGNANSVTIVTTKKRAKLSYQNNLALHNESYRNYIKQHSDDDSKVKYLLNAKAANMDALYNLKPDSINEVSFALANGKPVVKVITK
jgi:hypothetical protein